MRGRVIEVITRRRMPVNTDGELTVSTPAEFRVVPGALEVFVPACVSVHGEGRWSCCGMSCRPRCMTSCWPASRSADGHEAAAAILADDPLAATLRGWAEQRRAAAARLGDILRELDDLPPEPDADLETVRELASRVKAALAPDQRQALVEERRAAEAHLLATIEQALARPELAEPARSLLLELRAAAAGAHEQLTELVASP